MPAESIAAFLFIPSLAQQVGLGGQFWYVAVVLLGLFCALLLFTLFRSYASYSGKVWGGQLKIAGPGVLMLVIVVLGFVLPPSVRELNLTIKFRLPKGAPSEISQALANTKLRLDIGAERQDKAIEAEELVRWMSIPASKRGEMLPVQLISTRLELSAGADAKLKLDETVVYLDVRWKTWQLQGHVQNEAGQAIEQAQITLAASGTGVNLRSDDKGRFSLPMSAGLTDAQRTLHVQANGYAPWRNTVVGEGPITVQLTAMPR